MGRRVARCRRDGCDAEIAFFRSPFTGNVRAFDARPVDGRDPRTTTAFPVMGRQAYKFPDLVELVQVQRQCTDVEAEAEVRDMPWHTLHDCATDSDTTTTEEENTHP